MAEVYFSNDGRDWIRDFIKDNIDNSGIGLDTSVTANSNGLFGGGTTIDACDATTGWSAGGDGSTITLNTDGGERQEGTGSLDIAAAYSSGEATYTKTVTSQDLSNSERVFVWFYVDDPSPITTASIVLGTGGTTNYNQYDTAGASLSVGWNSLEADLASTPSSTGGSGATESDIDTIQLKLEITSAPSDMRMDYWRYYESGTDGITDSQSAPTITTGDRFVKTVHTINSTDSNGLPITSAADHDDTIQVFTMNFTEINKTDSDQIQVDKYYYIE